MGCCVGASFGVVADVCVCVCVCVCVLTCVAATVPPAAVPPGSNVTGLRIAMSTLIYGVSQMECAKSQVDAILGRSDLDENTKLKHISDLLKHHHKQQAATMA